MKNRNFLYLIITALFALNVFTLAFFFLKGPQGGERGMTNPKMIVIKKLHFDKGQAEAYEKLISEHQEKIKALDDTIKHAKKELYSNLPKHQNTVSNDSLYEVIANSQAEIEMVHYRHFLDIRNLCKPDQMRDFEKLSNELAKLFEMHKGPKK